MPLGRETITVRQARHERFLQFKIVRLFKLLCFIPIT